jgi:hypothetical protein
MEHVDESEGQQLEELTKVGRILGPSALILGPLFWCVGLSLRTQAVSSAGFTREELTQHATEQFAAREQLATYAANPALTIAGYATFLIGAILLIPAMAILAYLAARRSPWLATAGGVLMVFGLVARVYFAGVEQVAFQMVDIQGLDAAVTMVLSTYVDISYGPWRVPVTAVFGQYLGMPLLAAGLYRARIFGGLRTLILLWFATMWGGVLKAAGWWDVVAAFALLIVFSALAVQLIRDGKVKPRPGRRFLSW